MYSLNKSIHSNERYHCTLYDKNLYASVRMLKFQVNHAFVIITTFEFLSSHDFLYVLIISVQRKTFSNGFHSLFSCCPVSSLSQCRECWMFLNMFKPAIFCMWRSEARRQIWWFVIGCCLPYLFSFSVFRNKWGN